LKDGIYGYSTLDVHLGPSVIESQYPIANKTSRVKPWAARYTEFRKGQDDSLELTVYNNNGNDIVAQIIEIGDEIQVSSVDSNRANPGTTSVPQESGKAILVATSQPDPPDLGPDFSNYSYSAEARETVASTDPTHDRKITTWGSIKGSQ
jgi:hypothetical protein